MLQSPPFNLATIQYSLLHPCPAHIPTSNYLYSIPCFLSNKHHPIWLFHNDVAIVPWSFANYNNDDWTGLHLSPQKYNPDTPNHCLSLQSMSCTNFHCYQTTCPNSICGFDCFATLLGIFFGNYGSMWKWKNININRVLLCLTLMMELNQRLVYLEIGTLFVSNAILQLIWYLLSILLH